jgi:putative exosortase-associated protein (TIGR04073 family)
MACAVLLCSVSASAEQIATKPNPAYGIARGFANLMTGWLELPRGLVYENARIPVVGFVSGPVKGAALMTWRTLAGTMDVVCMGLTRQGLYTEQVPDFVWDADWVPKCGEDMVSMESIESKPCAEKPKVIKKRKVIIKAPCEPCEQMKPKVMKAAPCEPCEKMQPKKVKKVKVKKWKAR